MLNATDNKTKNRKFCICKNKCKCNANNIDTILNLLKHEWQDYFYIRSQSWKSVIASGALLVGLLTASKTNFSDGFAIVGCVGLIALSVFGILVTSHHRKCEQEKLSYIQAYEKLLTIYATGENVIDFLSRQEYSRIKKGSNGFGTTMFIICYHYLVLLLCLIWLHLALATRNCVVIYNCF